MIKKQIWFLFLILLVATACNNSDQAVVAPVATTIAVDTTNGSNNTAVAATDETVTVLFAVYDWESPQYDSLIKAFEAENPSIHIEVKSINEILGLGDFGGDLPEDANLRLVSSADVINIGSSQKAIEQGLLLDLTPFIEADPRFQASDFYPGLLEQYQSGGSTWALPIQVQFELIFYLKDAFDAAGLPYPQPGWTWDEFLATAQTLTIRDGDKVIQWGFAEPSPGLLNFIEDRAGALFNIESELPTVRLDETAVINAVTWYSDLYLVHQVAPYSPPPEEGSFTPPESFQLIEEGKVAMWPAFSGSWEYYSERQMMNVGVVPFPVDGPNSKTSPIYSDSFSISAGSQNAEAAWKWIDFLSQQNSGGEGSHFGGLTNLPARRSVTEAGGYWEKVDAELGAALQFAIGHAYAQEFVTWGHPAFYEAIDAILSGEKSVEEALTTAQSDAENSLAENLTKQGLATPVTPVVVVKPEENINPNAVMILFSIGGGLYSLQSYRYLATQFQQNHPDIIVKVQQSSSFSGSVTMAEASSKSDCFQSSPSLDTLEATVTLLSLNPLLDNDPDISEKDFFPTAIADFTYQGKVWGLPADISIGVVEYNKELFDAAGLEYPTPDWTIENFLALAVTLTRDEGEAKQYGFVPNYLEAIDLLNFIEQAGATLIDDSLEPPALTFTHPSTVEAVRWFTSLTTEYGVKPTFVTKLEDTNITDFTIRQTLIDNNQAGMWSNYGFGNGAAYIGGPDEAEQSEPRIGVVPLPAGSGGTRAGVYQAVNGFFISADTEAREACWTWIKFLTEQSSVVSGLPARISVAESEAYRQQAGEERAEAYLVSMHTANNTSFYRRFSVESRWLGVPFVWLARAYDQILNNDLSVEEALTAAQETADTYRTCILATGAFPDEIQQQKCLEEADPLLPANFFITPGQ